MTRLSDNDLLRLYVRSNDGQALSTLIARHIAGVYASARRQVGDAHLAEDVTQAVFLLLTRKAGRIVDRNRGAIAGWLFTVTRYAAANARKLRQRRLIHESRAAVFFQTRRESAERGVRRECGEILGVLDDAIAQLPAAEQRGVILWSSRQCTYQEIGDELGVSEDAARKRVARAITRMRRFFVSRGVRVSSAAIASTLLHDTAAAAPAAAELAGTTCNIAMLSGVAASTGTTSAGASIAKGVTGMLAWVQLKAAAVVLAATVAAGVGVTAAIAHRAEKESVATPIDAAADDTLVKLDNGVTVQFLGTMNTSDDGSWFNLAGKKVGDPGGPWNHDDYKRPEQFHTVMRIDGAVQPSTHMDVSGVNPKKMLLYVLDDGPTAQNLLARYSPPEGQKTAEFKFYVSTSDWQTIGTTEHAPGRPPEEVRTPHGGFVFTHASDRDGRTLVYVASDYTAGQWSAFAVDSSGKEHFCDNCWDTQMSSFSAVMFDFPFPPDQVVAFVIKTRPWDHTITIKDVTLDPNTPTKPTVTVEKIGTE